MQYYSCSRPAPPAAQHHDCPRLAVAVLAGMGLAPVASAKEFSSRTAARRRSRRWLCETLAALAFALAFAVAAFAFALPLARNMDEMSEGSLSRGERCVLEIPNAAGRSVSEICMGDY